MAIQAFEKIHMGKDLEISSLNAISDGCVNEIPGTIPQ